MNLLATIMTSLQATDLAEFHSFALIGRQDHQGGRVLHTHLWVAATTAIADKDVLSQLAGKFFPKKPCLQTSPSPAQEGHRLTIGYRDEAARQAVTIYCFSSVPAALEAYSSAKSELQPAAN